MILLKNKVYSNQEVYIRGMGRDATGTKYMLEVHKSLFGNSNIKKDPSNNTHPTKILENLTGFSKRKFSFLLALVIILSSLNNIYSYELELDKNEIKKTTSNLERI